MHTNPDIPPALDRIARKIELAALIHELIPQRPTGAVDPMESLALVAEARNMIEQAMVTMVQEARSNHVTWEQIAAQIGGTRQAAQQRYGS